MFRLSSLLRRGMERLGEPGAADMDGLFDCMSLYLQRIPQYAPPFDTTTLAILNISAEELRAVARVVTDWCAAHDREDIAENLSRLYKN